MSTDLKMMIMAQRILAPYTHPKNSQENVPAEHFLEITTMQDKIEKVFVSPGVFKDLTTKVAAGNSFEFPWRLRDKNFVFYGAGDAPKVATRVRLISKKSREDVARIISAQGGTIAEAHATVDKHIQSEAEDGANQSGDTIASLTNSKVLVLTKNPETSEVTIRKDDIELTEAQQKDVIVQLSQAGDIFPDMPIRNMTVEKVLRTRSELVITLSKSTGS